MASNLGMNSVDTPNIFERSSLAEDDEICSDSEDSRSLPSNCRTLESPSSWIIDRNPVPAVISSETIPETLTTFAPDTVRSCSTDLDLKPTIIPYDGHMNSRSTIAFHTLWNVDPSRTVSEKPSTETWNQVRNMVGNGVPMPSHHLPIYNKTVDQLYKKNLESFIKSLQNLVPHSIYNSFDKQDNVLMKASEYIYQQDLEIHDHLVQDLNHAIHYGEIMAQILDDRDKTHHQMIYTLKYCRDILTRSYPYNQYTLSNTDLITHTP